MDIYEMYKMPWFKKMKKFSSITYLTFGNERLASIISAGLFAEAKGNPGYGDHITEYGRAYGDGMIPKEYAQREAMLETRVYYSRIWFEDKREGAEIKHVLINPFGRYQELEFEDSFVLNEEK